MSVDRSRLGVAIGEWIYVRYVFLAQPQDSTLKIGEKCSIINFRQFIQVTIIANTGKGGKVF